MTKTPSAGYIVVTISPATERSLGRVEEGWFSLADGAVEVTGVDGRPIGKRKLEDGEDPRAVAVKILKGHVLRVQEADFHRVLTHESYGPSGWIV
jgi:hypothetical protein